MGRMKNFHYTMKDKEDWTDEDWEMYFYDLRYNEDTAKQKETKQPKEK